MPGPIAGDLFARRPPTGELAQAFRSAAARVVLEADSTVGGIQHARSEGAGLGSGAAGVAGALNQIAAGVGDSYPGSEASDAWAAGANSPGVSGVIGQAEASSGDPRVYVPGVDTGGGTGWIGGNAGDIRGRGRTIEGQAGEADRFERDALERQI